MSFSSFGVAPGTDQTRADEPFGAASPTFSFAPKPPGDPAMGAPAAPPSAAVVRTTTRRWLPWTVVAASVVAGAVGGILLLTSTPPEAELVGPVAVAPPAASPSPEALDAAAAPPLAAPVDGRNVFAPLYSGAASGGTSTGEDPAAGAAPTPVDAGAAGAASGTTAQDGAASTDADGGTAAGTSVSVEWMGPSADGSSQVFQVAQDGTTTAYAAAPGQPLSSVPPLSWVTVVAGVDETSAGLVAGTKSYVLHQGVPVTLS